MTAPPAVEYDPIVEQEPAASPTRDPARRTFAGFALLYALFAWPAPPLDPVAGRTLGLARAFSRGSAWVGPEEGALAIDVTRPMERGGGGRAPLFGFGVSLAVAPLCLVSRGLVDVGSAGGLFLESGLALFLLVVPLGAASVVLLGRLLERLEAPHPWAAATAYGLAFPFPLATTLGPHVPGLFLGLLGLTAVLSQAGPRAWAAGGAALGAAVLCDFSLLTSLAAPVGVWVVLTRPERRAAFALGAALPAAALLGRNALYFGGPFRVVPPPELMSDEMRVDAGLGAFGLADPSGLDPGVLVELLLGQRAGLFFFAPVLVLGLVGLRDLARRDRSVCALVVGVVLLALLQNALKRAGWFGSTSKGPRYLLPAAAALAVPLAFGLARRPRLGFVLAGLGVAVSAVQAETPFYATFSSSARDLLQFGPRLRLVHSLAAVLRPGWDASALALAVSPLIAFPALFLVVRLLAPPPLRGRVFGAVLAAWAAAAGLSLAVRDPAVTRASIRVDELRSSYPDQPWPHRLCGYGDELLAFGRPELAAECFVLALERGQRDDPIALRGLARAAQALQAAGRPDLARAALQRAAGVAPPASGRR